MQLSVLIKTSTKSTDAKLHLQDRFYRQDDKYVSGEKEWMRIDVTSWSRAHPGGESVLQKFHGKDAMKVFKAVWLFRMQHMLCSENSKSMIRMEGKNSKIILHTNNFSMDPKAIHQKRSSGNS